MRYTSKFKIQGDVNGDGKVNTFDLQQLLVMVSNGKAASADKAACDMNKDGSVDSIDVRALLMKIL